MDRDLTKELPKQVVIKDIRLDENKSIRQDITNAQNAYASLRGMRDYKAPTMLEDITIAHLDEWCERRVQRILQDETLTEDERDSKVQNWRKIHKQAATAINAITRATSQTDCKWCIDEQANTIVLKHPTVEELAAARSTRDVPSIAQEHWDKMQAVYDAIENLRKWELEQDIKKIRLDHLLTMDVQRFAGAWALGNMTIDHSLDDNMAIGNVKAMREIEYALYL